jgi:hypothetical protein
MFAHLLHRSMFVAAVFIAVALGVFLLVPIGLTSPSAAVLVATHGGCDAPSATCYNSNGCVNTGSSSPPRSIYYQYSGIPWYGASESAGDLLCFWRYYYTWANCNTWYESWAWYTC